MPDAVLLVADLAADRYPTTCVRTGEKTTRATHLWALASRHADRVVALLGIVGVLLLRAVGVQAMRVPIPVAEGPYRFWRRRAVLWAAVACFGLGLVAVSPARGGTPLAVIGVLVMVAAALLRARAHSGFWISAELRPAKGHVIIRRTHPAFDAEARTLFVRRLQR